MLNLSKELENAKTVGISGHIRPDGDCIGSTMGLYLYLKKNRPELDVHVFLEKPAPEFDCIKDIDVIEKAEECNTVFDLFFAIDCSKDRLGEAERLFDMAAHTVNIDHHISNPGTGDYNYIDADASSASELVYDLCDLELMDVEIAKALYIGIIHDTGVLQYSCTSPKTLEAVAKLIAFGFDFPAIIQETFYQKTFVQTHIMGRALVESFLVMDGKVAVGRVDRNVMDFYCAEPHDLDAIVNQLKNIKGVEVAIFMYQLATMEYKVSLRSNGLIDVAKIASGFGGGGHVRAAGCTLSGNFYDVVNNITSRIDAQFKELK